jgi:hypothetical protein
MGRIYAFLHLTGTGREYEFLIDRRQDPPILHIPGDHRGPDLCFPLFPEQEEWLNGLDRFMTPLWYCQWKFRSVQACSGFEAYLKRIAQASTE